MITNESMFPVLTCKKAQPEFCTVFTLDKKYEVVSSFNLDNEEAEILVIDDSGCHHYLSLDWMSEHFELDGDLFLVEEWL